MTSLCSLNRSTHELLFASSRIHLASWLLAGVLIAGLVTPGSAAAESPSSNPGAISQESSEADGDDNRPETVPFGFDFAPFIGTSSALPGARRTVSISMFGGLSGGIDAVELGMLLNLSTGSVRGLQLTPGVNTSTDLTGLQLSGLANIGVGRAQGLQASTALNTATDVEGLQLGGLFNLAVGSVQGAQVTPGVNVAAGEVDGLQLGVVNVAQNSDASVGLISVLWDGFVDLEAFGSDEGLALAGLRHGGDHLYNVYFAGARLLDGAPDPAFGLGIGWRHILSTDIELNTDVSFTQIAEQNGFERYTGVAKLRPLVAWRPTSKFAVFGGPTLSAVVSDGPSPLLDRAFWNLTGTDADTRAGAWIGATLGVRFL